MASTSVDTLREAILERNQPRTADLFVGMVKREGRSVADALGVVTTAEAPFVQVPSHINVRDGVHFIAVGSLDQDETKYRWSN